MTEQEDVQTVKVITNKKIFVCECGKTIANKNRNKHYASNLHKAIVEGKTNEIPLGRHCVSSVYETIQCPCSGHYNEKSESVHKRTKLHLDYLNKNNPPKEKKVVEPKLDILINVSVLSTIKCLQHLNMYSKETLKL